MNVTSVFELSFHIERLAESARLMQAAAAADSSTATSTAPAALLSADTLRPLVLTSMRAAVAAYHAAQPALRAGAASAGVNGGAADGSGELKVTILSHWEHGEAQVDTHVQALGARPAWPVKVQVCIPHVKRAPRARLCTACSSTVSLGPLDNAAISCRANKKRAGACPSASGWTVSCWHCGDQKYINCDSNCRA